MFLVSHLVTSLNGAAWTLKESGNIIETVGLGDKVLLIAGFY